MLKFLKQPAQCIAVASVLSLLQTPLFAQDKLDNTPAKGAQTAEQLLTDGQFIQLCSAEKVFGFFQRVCLAKSANAAAVTDAWVIFRTRNRDALQTLRQACQSSRRWPALATKMAQDEQKAEMEWQNKPPEQIETFCGQLPAALSSAELEAALRKFADQVKIAPAPAK